MVGSLELETGGVAMISVILVTYQSMKVLPACLESLERSSLNDELDLWLVDNRSEDGTWDWVNDYARQKSSKPFSDIHVLQLENNNGFAYANNRALELAKGDYFLLLNPDTIVGEKAIQICLDNITEDPAIGAITCRLELGTGELDKACRRSFPTLWNSFAYFSGLSKFFSRTPLFASYQLTYLDEFGAYPVDTVSGAFLLFPRSVYQLIGGLDEDYFMYGEDIDFCYRMKQKGFAVWYEGSVTTIHLKGGNGGKKSKASLRHFYDTMGIFFEKHYADRYPRWLLALINRLIHFLYLVQKSQIE